MRKLQNRSSPVSKVSESRLNKQKLKGKRRAAGKLGGRPPNTEGSVKNQEKQMLLSKSEKSIRAPDNENENENGNVLKENVLTDMKEKSMQEQAFDEFWAIYPKKKSKGQAKKAWMKLKPDNDVTAKIMSKIPELSTDMSDNQIISLVYQALGLNFNDLGSYRIPVDGGYTDQVIRGMEVLVPDLEVNRKAILQMITGSYRSI